MSGVRIPVPGASAGGTLSRIAAAVVIVFVSASLYPLRPGTQEDLAGARFLPPLSRAHAVQMDDQRVWIVQGLRRGDDGWVGSRAGRPVRLDPKRVTGPPHPRFYLLGTDALGRDLTSRLLHALRRSIGLAASSVLLALAVGTSVGLAAALGGRAVDAVLMRCVDAFLAVPRLLLVLLTATLLRPSVPVLIAILGGLSWPGTARLVRAEALSAMRADFTLAARSAGCSPVRLAVGHLLPQLETILAVTGVLLVVDVLVLESALAFVGLVSAPEAVSLGEVIASGRSAFDEAWWLVVFPVATLSGTVLTIRSVALRHGRRPSVRSVA